MTSSVLNGTNISLGSTVSASSVSLVGICAAPSNCSAMNVLDTQTSRTSDLSGLARNAWVSDQGIGLTDDVNMIGLLTMVSLYGGVWGSIEITSNTSCNAQW